MDHEANTGTSIAPQSIETLDAERTALFFDFDGVLADIADKPSAVRVEPEVLADLSLLTRATGGAIAVVSGREISGLDRFLSPLRLAAAGMHGVERRSAAGTFWREEADERLMQLLTRPLVDFAREAGGLLVERKPSSIALHYRQNPALAQTCLAVAERLAAIDPRIRVLKGKMVVELKTSSRTKADAIRDFMGEDPFAGRVPVFFGDDVTDEDGFREINRLGGVSVKIGDGDTEAHERLADTSGFRRWLKTTTTEWARYAAVRRSIA